MDSKAETVVYVGNLKDRTEPNDVEDAFKKFGKINDVRVRSNREKGTTFAFVHFADHRDAEDAVAEMSGKTFQGRELFVQINDFNTKTTPKGGPDSRVYVGNLPNFVNEKELKEMFDPYGEVLTAAIRSNPKLGTTFGFIEFGSDRDAQRAVDKMHDNTYKGKRLVVQVSRPRPPLMGGGRRDDRGGRGREYYPDRDRSRSRSRGRRYEYSYDRRRGSRSRSRGEKRSRSYDSRDRRRSESPDRKRR